MRRRKLKLSPEGLIGFLVEGKHHYEAKGIPKDAKVIDCRFDNFSNCFVLVLESEGWEHLKEGNNWDVVPEFTLI